MSELIDYLDDLNRKEEEAERKKEEERKKHQEMKKGFPKAAQVLFDEVIEPKILELISIFTGRGFSAEYGQLVQRIDHGGENQKSFTVNYKTCAMQVDIVQNNADSKIDVFFIYNKAVRSRQDASLSLSDTTETTLERLVLEAFREMVSKCK
jgi:hypothetical protein